MSNIGDIVLNYVIPTLGSILLLILGLSPVSEMRRCSVNGTLGEMNPLPYCAFFFSNIIWVVYSVLIGNIFTLTVSCMMLVINMQLTFTGYRLASSDYKLKMECMMHGYSFLLMMVAFFFMYDTYHGAKNVCGYISMIFYVTVFVPPLFHMKTVIETQNSEKIFAPFAMIAVVKCGCWTVYGIVVNVTPLWVTNGLGLILSIAQLALVLMYPAGHSRTQLLESAISLDNPLPSKNNM